MPWLLVYGSVAVAVLAVLTLCCARNLRGDFGRLIAIAAAAALWPVLAVGLLQFWAIHTLAGHLRRRAPAPAQPPVAVVADPATTPTDLIDSMARLAQRISPTRHA